MPEDDSSTPMPAVEVCAEFLKALADPVRLQIVKALQSGPMSVSDLALLLDGEVANVSHHLRVLFHAHLVVTERDGRFKYYRLNPSFLKRRSQLKLLDFGCCTFDLKK